jgi:hypothetical protein
MAQLHQEHDRATRLQANLEEVLRQEELNFQQPPGEGWFEIATLKDVVERWQEKIAANPGYLLQLQFPTGWNWCDYFSDTPPASADARLWNDLDKLAEYIERAVWLGETHATCQISM